MNINLKNQFFFEMLQFIFSQCFAKKNNKLTVLSVYQITLETLIKRDFFENS